MGGKSIPKGGKGCTRALRLWLESLTRRQFHARDVQPSSNELRAPHARLTQRAGFAQHSEELWLTSLLGKNVGLEERYLWWSQEKVGWSCSPE